MTKVSTRPTRSLHTASIDKTQQSTIAESTGMQTNAIRDTHRRRLDLGVGLLVVHDLVDGGRHFRWRIYSCGRNSPTFTTPS
jgi:hypothetical protein